MQAVISAWRERLRPYMEWVIPLAFILGFVGGFFTTSTHKPRTQIPGLTEGFLLVTPTAQLADASNALRLRGQKVNVVHRDDETSPPCKAGHIPLRFSANENISVLSGTLDEIDQLISSIQMNDLKRLELTHPQDLTYPPCQKRLKIIYGEGDLP